MVTIVDFKTYQREDGTDFNVLIAQGGIEAVKSKVTQKTYLTARKANVPTTFNAITCEGLIGTQLPGSIKKVEVDPYQYLIPDTGEMITLSHHYEYMDDQDAIITNNVVDKEMVA